MAAPDARVGLSEIQVTSYFGFGLQLIAHEVESDVPGESDLEVVCVSQVRVGSPCFGRIVPGDVLVALDGLQSVCRSLASALEHLAAAPKVVFEVLRLPLMMPTTSSWPRSSIPTAVTSVSIQTPDIDAPIPIVFGQSGGDLIVSAVIDGAGSLEPGTRVVAINGQVAIDVRADEANRFMRSLGPGIQVWLGVVAASALSPARKRSTDEPLSPEVDPLAGCTVRIRPERDEHLGLLLLAKPGAQHGADLIYIGHVFSGSPAERAGLKAGQQVLAFNGLYVGSGAEGLKFLYPLLFNLIGVEVSVMYVPFVNVKWLGQTSAASQEDLRKSQALQCQQWLESVAADIDPLPCLADVLAICEVHPRLLDWLDSKAKTGSMSAMLKETVNQVSWLLGRLAMDTTKGMEMQLSMLGQFLFDTCELAPVIPAFSAVIRQTVRGASRRQESGRPMPPSWLTVEQHICILAQRAQRRAHLKAAAESALPSLQSAIWALPHWTTQRLAGLARTFSAGRQPAITRSRKAQPKRATTELTAKMARLVLRSWKVVEKRRHENSVELMRRVFELSPEIHELFKQRLELSGPLEDNQSLIRHANHVFSFVRKAVYGIQAFDTLLPRLQDLGAAHASLVADPEDFNVFGEAIVWTVQRAVGKKAFTAKLQNAWKTCVGKIIEAMQNGHARQLQDPSRPVPLATALDQEPVNRAKSGSLDGATEFLMLRCQEPEFFPEAISVARKTWATACKSGELAGELFRRMFELNPPMRESFHSVFDARGPVDTNPLLMAHAERVFQALERAMSDIEDMSLVIPMLQSLGERHAAWVPEPAMFDTFIEAFVWVLERCLGKRWTAKAAAAWHLLLPLIIQPIKLGLELATRGRELALALDVGGLDLSAFKVVIWDFDLTVLRAVHTGGSADPLKLYSAAGHVAPDFIEIARQIHARHRDVVMAIATFSDPRYAKTAGEVGGVELVMPILKVALGEAVAARFIVSAKSPMFDNQDLGGKCRCGRFHSKFPEGKHYHVHNILDQAEARFNISLSVEDAVLFDDTLDNVQVALDDRVTAVHVDKEKGFEVRNWYEAVGVHNGDLGLIPSSLPESIEEDFSQTSGSLSAESALAFGSTSMSPDCPLKVKTLSSLV